MMRSAADSLLLTVQCTVHVPPVRHGVWPLTMGWWADATPAQRPMEPTTAASAAAIRTKMRFTAILSGCVRSPKIR
jgi:hypothetical protein